MVHFYHIIFVAIVSLIQQQHKFCQLSLQNKCAQSSGNLHDAAHLLIYKFQITRPDSKPDNLGLNVLDEPCAKQSDPVVLDLQLRAISKQTTDKKLVSIT